MSRMITTSPTWDFDSAGADPYGIALVVAIVLIVFSIATLIREPKWATKTDRRIVLLCFAPAVVGILLAIVGGVGLGLTYAAVNSNHQAAIASWLHREYGATVNPDKLTAETDADVIQTTAAIDGRIRVIKLMPTPDGHIAVFGTDDKPLPKHH